MEANKILKQIKIIFWSILSGLIFLLLTSLIVVNKIGPAADWSLAFKENFKAVILLLSLVGIPASYFFHSQKVKHINAELPFDKQLLQFKTSFFIKLVTIESLAFLGLIGYMLTADFTFIYVFALLFLAYLINRPSRYSIIKEINPEQLDQDNNENTE
ncbi:hypothetical protein ACT29H_07525 [Thermophagus sp. OGC60D27]|uniref:hypothetical protein n=1 Tax=Thermophagus sp. OGC60D27 TaxID=3458415 RepID=UPI004037D788